MTTQHEDNEADAASSSGDARPHYKSRLRPMSAEEIRRLGTEASQPAPAPQPKRTVARPDYVASGPAVAARSTAVSDAFLRKLEQSAAGKTTSLNINLELFRVGSLLMIVVLALFWKFRTEWLENARQHWILIALALLISAINVWVLVWIRGKTPDVERTMKQQAIANLGDGGLLRAVLAAQDTHSLLPPNQASILTRELTSSNRRFSDDEARIKFLLENYLAICAQRELPWHGPLSETEKRNINQLTIGKSAGGPVHNMLCGVLASMLRYKNY